MATKPAAKKLHHTKRYRQTNVNDLVHGVKLKNPSLVGAVGGAGRGQGRKPSRAKTAAQTLAADIINGKRVIKEAGDELPDTATPLDVMLMAMRSAYKIGGSLMAFPYAEKAAPYLHARIAQVQLKAPDESKGGVIFGWISDVQKPPGPSGDEIEVVDGVTKLLEG